jgi:hypothetical protein
MQTEYPIRRERVKVTIVSAKKSGRQMKSSLALKPTIREQTIPEASATSGARRGYFTV